MNYRMDKYGNQLSILGFGCLRFPKKNGRLDMEASERQILRAIEGGVNYFDTAYTYGGSEALLGEVLERNHVRDRVNIATKLPHYLIRNRESMEKCFQEELKRLRTDHVEYYLMHMLNDVQTWQRLQTLGVEEWIAEKKASGQIGQIGFSYHGNSEMFCALVDAYDWDFCQIQYNYLDEHSQAGRRGLHHAARKGLPVIIMEPLRGGKLVNLLPEGAKVLMAEHPVSKTPARWGFDWLWDQEEVTVVLSGMNSLAMVEENLQAADAARMRMLTDEDRWMLRMVVAEINDKMKVGCTGCGYCMPCPAGVDIPGTFAAYNRYHTEGKFSGFREYVMCTALRKNSSAASLCIGCGRCEGRCPQQLPIRDMLREAKKELENPVYKAVRGVLNRFVHF